MRRLLNWVALSTLIVITAVVGCRHEDSPTIPAEPVSLSLLALGDSYTVGQSLPEAWSWPRQLADSLASWGDTLQNVDVLAQTGWTTRDLLDAIRQRQSQGLFQETPYGVVTLMIGVNNQFQGVDPEVFATEMDTLISLAMVLAGGQPQRVLGFSIPDYGVTPVGQLFNAATIAEEIQLHNEILFQKYHQSEITMLDITPLSQEACQDPTLVARDGLHYSREMYRRWVEFMLPNICSCLGLALAP